MSISPESNGPTVCLGEILVEIISTAKGFGFQEIQSFMGPYPSGAPCIFIDQCARLGGKAIIIGSVGNDDFGRLCQNRLKNDGVDVSYIEVNSKFPTGTAFVRYNPDGERNFIFNMWTSAAGLIRWSSDLDTIFNQAGHFHIMGTLLSQSELWPLVEKAATLIKNNGGSISFDPNVRVDLNQSSSFFCRLSKILSNCDIVLPSGPELQFISGESSKNSAVKKLLSLGIKEVVLKEGANGATVYTSNEANHLPAFPINEVDPTGAGDCFGGAYITSRRLGFSILKSLEYANAAGARNVSVRGPMEGAGTKAELDEFKKYAFRSIQ